MKHTLLLFFLIIINQTYSQSKNQPIGFKENKGQIIDQKGKPNTTVKYLLNSNGLNVQLKKNGFSYDVYEVKKTPIDRSQTSKKLPYQIPEKGKETKPEYSLEYIFHRIDIDFVNSNSKVELITEQKSSDFDNYYNVLNKPEGITNVYQYKQITYKNIYPNIDVVFSIPNDPQKTVEYNFVIHPKGKIADIQLKFNGAETELVDNKIQMNVRFGKMEETLPASWIEDGIAKKEIAVGYKKIKKNVYGFDSSNALLDKTIIIDPVPIRLWGTYHGGSDYSTSSYEYSSTSIKTDSFENVIITGKTTDINNIATVGAFQFTYNNSVNNVDVGYITKFDKNGLKLWGTYVQNLKYLTEIFDSVINKSDEIYVVGYTFSYDELNSITTPNSHQEKGTSFNRDGFIIKFDSTGKRIWGTFYGGDGNDQIRTISLDSQENLVIGGRTNSTSGISTANSFQTINKTPFGGCGFFARFNPSGNLLYGSYFPREVNHLVVDYHDNIIFTGVTTNDSQYSNVATPGSHQQDCKFVDGYIAKFDKNGNQLWCTNYGGDASYITSTYDYLDEINGLGIDGNDNIYIVGTTNSINGIATIGVYKEQQVSGGVDAFLAKFSPSGVRQWGTYFGNNSIYFLDKCSSGFVSKDGNVFITGTTNNSSDIATPGSYQPTLNGGQDAYFSKFDTNGTLIWSTYYGGASGEYPGRIFYENNNIYLLGYSYSDDNLTTPGTYKPKGVNENFIAKFQDCLSTPLASSNSPVCVGKTLELKASGGANYLWTGPNGFTSTDQNPTIVNATALNSGEYSCLITGTGGCDDTKKINVVIGDIQTPIPDLATLPTITGDCHTTITTIPTATDACVGPITATTINPLSYDLPGTYTIIWNYNDGNGNISHQNQTVTITSQPIPTANTPQTFCILQNATFNDVSITGQNIQWYTAQATGTILPNTTILQNGITYYASQTINGCESSRIPIIVNIQNTLPPTGNTNQPFCTGQNPTLANINVTGNLIKWYDASANGNLLPLTTALQNGKTYYASQTTNNCESQRLAVTVSIVNTPSVPTQLVNSAYCKNENATLNNIQVSGQNLKWYSSNIAAGTLPSNTLLENNTTYYVSQTVGCESDRTPILAQVYDTALPTGNSSKQFCIDENATLASIGISGTAIKWYDSATNGNILPQTTLLQNGIYYATQTLNNCESQRLAVTVIIQDTQIPIADSPQKFCIQKKASIADIEITGHNIKWFDSASSTINLAETTLLENGITYFASQTINSCESDKIPVTIAILEATTADCINFIDELPYPKFFTPNNDSYNDTWTIDFAYLAPNTGIKIFDRYGKFIKELYNNSVWNGTYIGQNAPASDYWFTVTRLNGTEYRGHFSLKR
jgi:gliding motility-associated-like protein